MRNPSGDSITGSPTNWLHLWFRWVAAAAILLLGMAAVSLALEIEPPSPCPAHSLVRVLYDAETASVAVVEIRDGLPVSIDTVDCLNGTMCFTGAPGSAFLVVAMEGGRLKLLAVRISGETPGPVPPPPPPPPPPGPDLPDGQYALAQYVYDLSTDLPVVERQHGTALAQSYRDGAAELTRLMRAAAVTRRVCVNDVWQTKTYVPGTVCDHIMETVAAKIKVRNTAIVSSSEWRTTVGGPLNDRLNELRRTEKSIRLVAGMGVALEEIATGFAAVK